MAIFFSEMHKYRTETCTEDAINACKKKAKTIREKYKDAVTPEHLDQALHFLDKLVQVRDSKGRPNDCTIL